MICASPPMINARDMKPPHPCRSGATSRSEWKPRSRPGRSGNRFRFREWSTRDANDREWLNTNNDCYNVKRGSPVVSAEQNPIYNASPCTRRVCAVVGVTNGVLVSEIAELLVPTSLKGFNVWRNFSTFF